MSRTREQPSESAARGRARAAPFSKADLGRAGYTLEGYSPKRPAPGGAPVRTPNPEITDVDVVLFGAEWERRRQREGGTRIGTDDRWPVIDATAPPFRHICKLIIKSATGRTCLGTGWLIGPRTVITAGHCLALPDEGRPVSEVVVVPAMTGDTAPYRSQASATILPSEGWMRGTPAEREEADYGAILLDPPGFPDAGSFGFGAAAKTGIAGANINIAGYPADLEEGRRQYFHGRPVVEVLPQQLRYQIDTFRGQSGSPIWIDVGGTCVAIGVHTAGSAHINLGVRITEQVFHDLLRWKRLDHTR